jgi:predicted aspartyl protease
VPAPLSGLGLIDTGATTSCIDNDLAQRLGLPVIDQVQMASASHASTQCPVYPVSFEIVGTNLRFEIARATGVTLVAQGLSLLVGRDVLHSCLLVYNGPKGDITIGM